MWERKQNKVWIKYSNEILAIDSSSARFLVDYLHFVLINRSHIPSHEVIDLQRYKIIREERKVRSAIREKLHVPFIFLSCNN